MGGPWVWWVSSSSPSSSAECCSKVGRCVGDSCLGRFAVIFAVTNWARGFAFGIRSAHPCCTPGTVQLGLLNPTIAHSARLSSIASTSTPPPSRGSRPPSAPRNELSGGSVFLSDQVPKPLHFIRQLALSPRPDMQLESRNPCGEEAELRPRSRHEFVPENNQSPCSELVSANVTALHRRVARREQPPLPPSLPAPP